MGEKKKKASKKEMTGKALTANKKNSLKSTGPKTAQGKITISSNSLKHGILSKINVLPIVESQEEWDEFVAELKNDLHPYGTLENTLVEKIANILWRMKRLAIYENETIAQDAENRPKQLFSNLDSNILELFNVKNEKQTTYQGFYHIIEEIKAGIKLIKLISSAFTDFFDLPQDEITDYQHSYGIIIMMIKALYDDNKKDILKDMFRKQKNLLLEYSSINVFMNSDENLKTLLDNPVPLSPRIVTELITNIGNKNNMTFNEMFSLASNYSKELLKLYTNDLDEYIKTAREHLSNYLDYSDRVSRIESHLNRILMQTLHELQRLQGMRIGISDPPDALDITGLDQ